MGTTRLSLSFALFLILLTIYATDYVNCDASDDNSAGRFDIEGKVEVTSTSNKDWIGKTLVQVDGGKYTAYLRNDGSFTVGGLPSGTYVVEITNPKYLFEVVRVDIAPTGKKRARRVNYLQPSLIKQISYPLEFRDRRKSNYFQQREQWKITDFLFNPMVLTMVLPLVLIVILPKMMNAADPEAQKEMQSQMKALNDKSSMPDMSEMLAGWLGGGSSGKSGSKQNKRR